MFRSVTYALACGPNAVAMHVLFGIFACNALGDVQTG